MPCRFLGDYLQLYPDLCVAGDVLTLPKWVFVEFYWLWSFFLPQQAERYFARMQEMGIPPDAVTAVTLLNAYSHSGEADKAPPLNLHDETGEEMSWTYWTCWIVLVCL